MFCELHSAQAVSRLCARPDLGIICQTPCKVWDHGKEGELSQACIIPVCFGLWILLDDLLDMGVYVPPLRPGHHSREPVEKKWGVLHRTHQVHWPLTLKKTHSCQKPWLQKDSEFWVSCRSAHDRAELTLSKLWNTKEFRNAMMLHARGPIP